MSTLSLIAAMANERVIGRDNTLPWRLPEDLQHFKRTTLGKPVIMGRKTWESLGRPLPGRRNIVVSRNPDYLPVGGELVSSLEAAMAATADVEEAFVIGGADLYRQALPLAQRIYLTEIAGDYAGDAHFPEFAAADWREVSREAHTSSDGIAYAFVLYQRG
ncbi:MAG: type 3 dihydrofolate reductase [Betaproteobacteria bacterium]|uniref:Dihydrofolate reductase n=1 Tax=Candidatus Proximibacter danicus TaxID=2954365 RepID=A0A9D7K3I7_9PROT|nr:type 3 dihydrofolate reductase [Candidatus Proximibacter danicus]